MILNELYTDGGVAGHNPSIIGGSWAYRRVGQCEIIEENSGIVTPDDVDMNTITNNFTEMYAMWMGLRSLPDNWVGTIYSDSQITLGRLAKGWRWNNIPRWLKDSVKDEKKRLLRMSEIRFAYVKAHPSNYELRVGQDAKGNKVSLHNVWCDEACTELADGMLRKFQIKKGGVRI